MQLLLLFALFAWMLGGIFDSMYRNDFHENSTNKPPNTLKILSYICQGVSVASIFAVMVWVAVDPMRAMKSVMDSTKVNEARQKLKEAFDSALN